MKRSVVQLSESKSSSDVLFVGVFEKEDLLPTLKKKDSQLEKILSSAIKMKRFDGSLAQTVSSYSQTLTSAAEIVFIGLGPKKKYNTNSLKKVISQALRMAAKMSSAKAGLLLSSFTGNAVNLDEVALVATSFSILTVYDFDKYKTLKSASGKGKTQKINELNLIIDSKKDDKAIKSIVKRAEVIANATVFARELVNEPANVLNASELTKRARKMAAESGLAIKVYGQKELEKMKMGGILAVNQGSTNPPALIQMEYGKNYKSKGTLCLVGKGVTFDTGGLSIKPAKGMEKMKYDMAGSAAVTGAMKAIADLKLPIHVVSLTPAVENNVSNEPIRPGDIIKMYNGKTVEVLNTDAEGRLILADALAFAKTFNPKAIIDLATLTGMCLYTFGGECCAIMGNDEKLIAKVKKASEVSGERCWELPMWSEYSQEIKGTQSDLKNIGGMYAGTITAAKFLEEFVPEGYAWVHMDIAGIAWAESAKVDAPVGATGAGVRLLTELAAEWSKK